MSVKKCDDLSISPWIRRFSHLIHRPGSVLDLAAGGGRHSRWFLELGHQATAVDRQIDDLKQLKSTLSPDTQTRFRIIEADLEDGSGWPLAGQHFDAVVVVNYLHRPLVPDLIEALKDGGVLLYETFAVGQEAYGRPSNPDFLLKPGELLEWGDGRLQVVAFEQGLTKGKSGPLVKQRIALIKDGAPAALAPS